jgi:hypothetical protein
VTLDLVDLINWGWTGMMTLGVAVSLWAMIDGYVDRATLRQAGINRDVAAVVRVNLRTAHASLLLHSFFLGLGVLALTAVKVPITGTYLAFVGAYIVVAAANVRAVLLNQLERVRLRQGRG